jgi:hypothetical protein
VLAALGVMFVVGDDGLDRHAAAAWGVMRRDAFVHCLAAVALAACATSAPEPPFRRFAEATHSPSGIRVVAGGDPGLSGEIACLGPGLYAYRRLADDLVYDVAISPDGRLAAAACADGRVLLLALPGLAGPRERARHAGVCRAVAFAPGGDLLASVGLDGKLLLADPRGEAPPLVIADHTAGAECVAWSPDGHQIASGARDGKVRVHRRDGRLLQTHQRLGGRVSAVAWSEAGWLVRLADGRELALPDR